MLLECLTCDTLSYHASHLTPSYHASHHVTLSYRASHHVTLSYHASYVTHTLLPLHHCYVHIQLTILYIHIIIVAHLTIQAVDGIIFCAACY